MKVNLILITVLLIFSLAASQPVSPLTPEELNSAIEIPNINDRPVGVGPGESVVYQVQGTDLYLKVSNHSRTSGKSSTKASTSASISPLAEWSTTQVCGIDVYVTGAHVADLRNRANITYYQSAAKAPAKFNWYDMNGTKTYAIGFSWTNLKQTSSPGTGVKFSSSGYVKAEGTLNRCILGVCGRQDYFVSYLRVDTSGTRCQ